MVTACGGSPAGACSSVRERRSRAANRCPWVESRLLSCSHPQRTRGWRGGTDVASSRACRVAARHLAEFGPASKREAASRARPGLRIVTASEDPVAFSLPRLREVGASRSSSSRGGLARRISKTSFGYAPSRPTSGRHGRCCVARRPPNVRNPTARSSKEFENVQRVSPPAPRRRNASPRVHDPRYCNGIPHHPNRACSRSRRRLARGWAHPSTLLLSGWPRPMRRSERGAMRVCAGDATTHSWAAGRGERREP
jgi:hypothetical protein